MVEEIVWKKYDRKKLENMAGMNEELAEKYKLTKK